MENEKNEIISEGNERREEVKEEKEEGEEDLFIKTIDRS